MRAVLTRVTSASVTIDGEVVGEIGKGFLILLGVGPNDTEKECRHLAEGRKAEGTPQGDLSLEKGFVILLCGKGIHVVPRI